MEKWRKSTMSARYKHETRFLYGRKAPIPPNSGRCLGGVLESFFVGGAFSAKCGNPLRLRVFCERLQGPCSTSHLGMQDLEYIYIYIYHIIYYVYICIHIYMPITSFDGPLLGFKKARSRVKDEKLRQEKAKMRKKTKH